jgi:hypothetical protein
MMTFTCWKLSGIRTERQRQILHHSEGKTHQGEVGPGRVHQLDGLDEGLTAFVKGKRVICVSGYDLYHSLSHGIALPDLRTQNSDTQRKQGSLNAQFDRLYDSGGHKNWHAE